MKKIRISVGLPIELYLYYRERSKITGLSMSHLIYQRLRTAKPIIIIDDEFLKSLQELKLLLKTASNSGCIDPASLQALHNSHRNLERMVDLTTPIEVLNVKQKAQDTGNVTIPGKPSQSHQKVRFVISRKELKNGN